jgi:hypothetical protein
MLLAMLGGCQNACQRICGRMASYARDCGYEVSAEEVRACRRAQAGEESREDRAVCRDFGDLQAIREEWTCEDLEDYWARRVPEPMEDTGIFDSAW